MPKVIQAGLAYGAIVLGAGFLLGLVRVPLLVPRIGERWAELVEMPIMAVVIDRAAGHMLRRFPDICSPISALITGGLGLALVIAAELTLAGVLQQRSIAQVISSRDQVSGSVYLVMLLIFAAMPRLRLPRHQACASRDHGA
ncbi:hypothetical protein BBFGKLBO_03049 [Synechococcus sp. CBW1107]|jgi:hypothetical protein|uniref:hypothetical protein n=1 Tax=Synechococcus sp. CBW1107 TaxID=2789857 RepID=UPI002AD553D3|nr:hypothetical protein [Synechococcus sp. CBW1107]CAK6701221.1 hypothetical protein BBFGKLBO_03049 [Synechococcus sp. CBW1107]